ncbi:hypothetical protein ACFSOZ_24175 [Mesorhizobium newzealandense]|uniref:Uncharacterized protein n=1 Tax=Mesorhizobium newzealandense TaxID=1300302 RepID=A0ABW4UGD5_9HYPH
MKEQSDYLPEPFASAALAPSGNLVDTDRAEGTFGASSFKSVELAARLRISREVHDTSVEQSVLYFRGTPLQRVPNLDIRTLSNGRPT